MSERRRRLDELGELAVGRMGLVGPWGAAGVWEIRPLGVEVVRKLMRVWVKALASLECGFEG